MKINSKISKKKLYYLIVENPDNNTFSIEPVKLLKQNNRKIKYIYLNKKYQGFCDITNVHENLETAFKEYIYNIYTDSGIQYTKEARKELFKNIKKFYLDSQIKFDLLFKDFLEQESEKIDFFTMRKY